MRLLYLIGAIVVFLLILILSLPQIGATCTWYLISATANATFVLFQAAALGTVLGGLLVLFWKTPKEDELGDDEDGDDDK